MSNWPNGAICEKATRPKGPLPAKGGGSRLGPCRRRLTTDPQSEGRLQGEVTSGVSSDAVDTAALVIAIISLVLAVLSLAWQAVTFVLTGPRVKVCLKEGLRGPLGVMIAPPSVYTDAGRAALEADGYTEHVLAVVVTNAGRSATTVRGWSLHFGNGVVYTNQMDPRNPALPHRLEPHTTETWYATVDEIAPFVENFVDQTESARTLRAEVDTATETAKSRERMVVAADGTVWTLPSRWARSGSATLARTRDVGQGS